MDAITETIFKRLKGGEVGMKFLISKASDINFNEEREINTMEELKELEKQHDGWNGEGGIKDFVINFGDNETPPKILIYDDWIE